MRGPVSKTSYRASKLTQQAKAFATRLTALHSILERTAWEITDFSKLSFVDHVFTMTSISFPMQAKEIKKIKSESN